MNKIFETQSTEYLERLKKALDTLLDNFEPERAGNQCPLCDAFHCAKMPNSGTDECPWQKLRPSKDPNRASCIYWLNSELVKLNKYRKYDDIEHDRIDFEDIRSGGEYFEYNDFKNARAYVDACRRIGNTRIIMIDAWLKDIEEVLDGRN